MWDGLAFTNYGKITGLPKHGLNAEGSFELIHSAWFHNKLYVVGSYGDDYTGNSPNVILEWNGSSWKDITNQHVQDAYKLAQFVEYQNNWYLTGVFKSTGLLKMDAGSWIPTGSPISSDKINDFVVDVEVFGNKIYATGEFTQPITNARFNLAVYSDKEWKPINKPPFLHRSKHLVVVGNRLHLTGDANQISDYVKSFNGVGWDNISSGLEDVEALVLWDFAGHKDLLCITGLFEKRSTGERFNFLIRDHEGWHMGDNGLLEDKISLLSVGTEIYAYGKFDFRSVANVGKVKSNHAVLTGKLFFDENENCELDGAEEGLHLARIILNPGDKSYFTSTDGSYEIPVGLGDYTLTYEPLNRHKYGCGRSTTVRVEKLINYPQPDLTAIEIPNVVDLELHSSMPNGWQLLRGQYNEIKLVAANEGTVKIVGATLVMKMGDWWNNVQIVPAPSSIDGDEYTWKISNLGKNDRYEIVISGEIKAELSLYNDFCFTGKVDLPQVDEVGETNRETGEFTSVNKIEPIWKQTDLGAWYNVSQKEVKYHIRIQNESDDVVNVITVRDTLDVDLIPGGKGSKTRSNMGKAKLPIAESIMLNGEARFIYTWILKNANLAPNGDPDGLDIGFVELDIEMHPFSQVSGLEICNVAYVEFGPNSEPIRTNTVCSESKGVGISTPVNPSLVQLYPNPATDRVTLKNNSLEDREVEVYSQLGQLVNEVTVRALSEIEVELSGLRSGIYFVKIVGFETQRLIVH